MPPEGLLGKDHRPIHRHLEDPAGGRDQLDVSVWPILAELGRQTGGPRLVVSDDAVVDGDSHGFLER
jgi:hypothetical protein